MDITPLRLPDYLYDSEEDDNGSVKTYQTIASDDDDDSLSTETTEHNLEIDDGPNSTSLINKLETATQLAYYLNHLCRPKKWIDNAEGFIYSYIHFISILGKVIKDDVIWIWEFPDSFSYNVEYLNRVLQDINDYIDTIYKSYECDIVQASHYDTMEMVNNFYIKLKHYKYDIPDIASMKDNLRNCLKMVSPNTCYKDLIYSNHIFKAFCICDE